MVTIEALVDILKDNQLWIADQFLSPDTVIEGKPVTDSRQLQPGDVFICIKGYQSDGHKFVTQARDKGVSIIIEENAFTDELPAIRVSNSRKAAAIFAKLYYNNPTGEFTLIGVTGTNGKTTTSMLIWQALSFLGKKAGMIGTLGYQIDSELTETNNTTPDIMELNAIFADMVKAGCKYVVMEVSSHALALDRVYGLEFDFALFTNLTRDHLDFHEDMSDYFENKYKLFEHTMKQNGVSILNIDDTYGKIIDKRISAITHYKKITISEKKGDLTILSCRNDTKGCYVTLQDAAHQIINFGIDLVGKFNMFNAVMAIAVIREIFPTLTENEIDKLASEFKPVRGRLEKVDNDKDIGVYVDYAHTPDAMKNVLGALTQLKHNRIITVFGAGGDRDSGKRSQMLCNVLEYSDVVIITDDNPRTENPNLIVKEIVGETDIYQPWWIIRDRKTAIDAAIRLALPDDIVLLAGKGHETYQEVNGVRHVFDDKETALKSLQQPTCLQPAELALPVDPLLLEILYKAPFSYRFDEPKCFRHITTDSRTTDCDSLYFALKGLVYDGMDFVDLVLSEKTNGAVINVEKSDKLSSIFYEDTQQALGLLARKYIQMFPAFRIALTGSTGKTTTKEYLANIFSETGSILKTYANENNIIGLSKTIFKMRHDVTTAIFELGTNHFGEISSLADICKPDLAIITNIGPSHLEFLNDEDGVYREKSEIFRKGAKTIIYPGDDDRFNEFSSNGKGVGYSDNCDYQIQDVRTDEDKVSFSLAGERWEIPQSFIFFVPNAAIAISTALESDIAIDLIRAGLHKPLELQQRMDIRKIRNLIVINDSYNANPVSMKAAIEFWVNYMPDKPHVAILGDMLELGDKAKNHHISIGALLNGLTFVELISIGEFSKYYTHEYLHNSDFSPRIIRHFETVDELLIKPEPTVYADELIVLIKASHGIHLEKVVEALGKETGPTYTDDSDEQ